jgi:uncharacterized membrane protein YdjX (TVP38/TMEM64 family)
MASLFHTSSLSTVVARVDLPWLMIGTMEIREPSFHANISSIRLKFSKYWSLIALILFAIFITLDFFFIGFTKSVLIAFLKWVEANPWPGVFTFSAVYCLATVLWIPGSFLTLGAGYIFGRAFGIGLGIALGTLSVFIGASSGAIFAFLLGRYIFHEIAQEWCKKYPILLAVDKVTLSYLSLALICSSRCRVSRQLD